MSIPDSRLSGAFKSTSTAIRAARISSAAIVFDPAAWIGIQSPPPKLKPSSSPSPPSGRQGRQLHLNLRIYGHLRYRHRNKASRVKIPNRRDISERPAVVQRRTRHGEWEADLIEGARGTEYILSLYERKSRYGNLIKLESKTNEEASRGIIKAQSHRGDVKLTDY